MKRGALAGCIKNGGNTPNGFRKVPRAFRKRLGARGRMQRYQEGLEVVDTGPQFGLQTA